MKIFLLVFLILIGIKSYAEAYIPSDPDVVVASWPARNNKHDTRVSERQSIAQAKQYLSQANQPGNSYMYGLAQATLEPWIDSKGKNSSHLNTLWARILQHQHNFDAAIGHLQQAIKTNANNEGAYLLLARLYVIKNEYSLARSSCSSLLGKSDLITASICLLEVASFQGQLKGSYRQLQKMLNLSRIDGVKEVWSRQILAEMAMRLEKFNESEAWLDMPLADKDLGFLIDWSETKFTLGKHCHVFDQLQPIAKNLDYVEDAIILRLALAEKKCGTRSSSNWRKRMQSRVDLREQRQDIHHASELAIYYMDLDPKPETALHWAKINWQQAKEHRDKALLLRAEQGLTQ